MENNTSLLEVKDLVVEYTSDEKVIHAVNSVSLEIKKGRTLGLVGETGAGKTSIAKAILRILPDPQGRIAGGKVLFHDQDILEMDGEKLREIRGKRISMIFQDPMTALNPTMRIGEQIADVLRIHKDCNKKQSQGKAMKILELVGIPRERFWEYPHQFSGGMKQRVVIAIALACGPELILADEPTTALDVTIQAQILEMIMDIRDKKGTSMLLITHDLGIVAETCDDVAVMYAGEIIESGSVEEVFDFTSHPYTLGLFMSLPDMNGDSDRLKPINGMPPDPSDLPSGCCFAPRCQYADERCKAEKPSLELMDGTHYCRCFKKKEDFNKEDGKCSR